MLITDIFVVGAGGLAKDVTLLLEDINSIGSKNKYNIAGYVINEPRESSFMGRDLLSLETFCEMLEGNKKANVVIAIGTPSVRQDIVNKLGKYDIEYPRLIHPSSKLNPSLNIKDSVTIFSNVILFLDIVIGKHTYIHAGCAIGHDVEIGDFVQMNPCCCISGEVKIGDSCLVGAGSIIHQGVKVGAGCTVGIGSVLFQNLKANTAVFGNPARRLPSTGQAV